MNGFVTNLRTSAIVALLISATLANAQEASLLPPEDLSPATSMPPPVSPPPVSAPADTLSSLEPVQQGYGLSAGATLYFLKPYFSSNPAYTSSVGTNNETVQGPSFNYNFGTAPAVWLGWTADNGFGIRGRFFYFDESSGTLGLTNPAGGTEATVLPPSTLPFSGPGTPSFGSPGVLLGHGVGTDQLTFSSELRIASVDLEATWISTRDNWLLQFSAGGRYLSMDQQYNASLTNRSAGGNETGFLSSSHNFNGGGPTMSFEAKYRTFLTNFWLFGSVRGSMLVGTSSSDTFFHQTVTGAGVLDQTSNPSASFSRDTLMPVVELELGMEYSWLMRRFNAFVRGAVVNQTYFDAGSHPQPVVI